MRKNIFRPNNVQDRPINCGSFDDSVLLQEEVKTKTGIQLVDKRVRASEYAKQLGLPKSNDFTLANQLSSGVPLREVPVSGILNPDPLSASGVAIGADATSKLEQEMSNQENQ